MPQITVFIRPGDRVQREREIAAEREAIEEPGSGLRVVGKPKVRRIWNRNQRYIEQPDAPRTVFRVIFQVEKTG